MAAQGDLFGPPLLPGLSISPDILTATEEALLIGRIRGSGLAPFRYQQWMGKRLTRSFGWNYDFQTGRFAPADPLPKWLLLYRDRAAIHAGLDPDSIAQALLIEYGEGSGIGWHRDRPVFEHIIGLSLGVAATMRFRRRSGDGFERATMALAPRSIYRLDGDARNLWEHSIAETSAPRWSITFRTLRDR